MTRLFKWAGFILCLGLATQSFAGAVGTLGTTMSERKFVKLPSGADLYIDYIPAQAGQRTLVILNGLTYATDSWDKLMPFIRDKGYGILRYDPQGMGKTLDKAGMPTAAFPIERQADDLSELLDALRIRGRVEVLGLSYGGGLALVFGSRHPQWVDKLILMAPYTEPQAFQDRWIKNQIAATRVAQPWNTATDDELYDFFLKELVYTTYPTAEPAGVRGPWSLEAIFRMVQGIRKMDTKRLVRGLPASSVHLVIAGQDQYIQRDVLEAFWDSLPSSSRSSKMVLEGSEHKIPEAKPRFAGAWVNLIMNDDSRLRNGAEFDGIPSRGVAKSDKLEISMPRE